MSDYTTQALRLIMRDGQLVRMQDVQDGDGITLYNPDGKFLYNCVVTGLPSLRDGVWGVMTHRFTTTAPLPDNGPVQLGIALAAHQHDSGRFQEAFIGMGQRIVCAALKYPDGTIVTGPRHFDSVMQAHIERLPFRTRYADDAGGDLAKPQQGFIDQSGTFLDRNVAHAVAKVADQIIRRVGGDESTLYSENLY